MRNGNEHSDQVSLLYVKPCVSEETENQRVDENGKE